MKVSECTGIRCSYCERRRWSHVHESANYHAIGMTHAYMFCAYVGKRCSQVKTQECPYKTGKNGDRVINKRR